MYNLSPPDRTKHRKHWEKFRLLSRQIIKQPLNEEIHTSRVMVALELDEKEPLQGALADMFYGCWFDTAYFADRILEQATDKLTPQMLADFKKLMGNDYHVQPISHFATRWSVLVSPTMYALEHQLRVSQDDSRTVAKITIDALLAQVDNHQLDDNTRNKNIKAIENEFFEHCLACEDRLAFSIVWWDLAKNKWDFHDEWRNCRTKFEEMNIQAKANLQAIMEQNAVVETTTDNESETGTETETNENT